MKESIFDKTIQELEIFCIFKGFKKFNASQVMRWIYFNKVYDFSRMTDVPKNLRIELSQSFKTEFPDIIKINREEDHNGRSEKYLLKLKDGEEIESVLLSYDKRKTLCISSQVGCKMGCIFCETGYSGFTRNLTSGEILSQILLIGEQSGENISNAVFMGMGEPLDNMDSLNKSISIMTAPAMMSIAPRKITISTCGLTDKFGSIENKKCKIAVSLNASDNKTRSMLMPVNKKYPLEDIIALTGKTKPSIHNKITMEYVLIKGINDGIKDASRLGKMFSPSRVKFNLIPLNERNSADRKENDSPLSGMKKPEDGVINAFKEKLIKYGFTVTVRFSKGRGINGGCGQLKAAVKRPADK